MINRESGRRRREHASLGARIRSCISAARFAAIVACLVTFAGAPAPAGYHNYSLRYYNANELRDFSYILAGQVFSDCRLNDFNSFVTLEMWMQNVDGTDWTETGNMDGNMNQGSYPFCWTGEFGATWNQGYYTEWTEGQPNPSLIFHFFEMEYDSEDPNIVDYYLDGWNLMATAYQPYTWSNQMQIGIESNSSYPGVFEYFNQNASINTMLVAAGSGWFKWPHTVPAYNTYIGVSSTYAYENDGKPHAFWHHR